MNWWCFVAALKYFYTTEWHNPTNMWQWSCWIQMLVWLLCGWQRKYSLSRWRLSVDHPLLIFQLNAEDCGSHFATCWESEQFSLLTGGPQLQITSSAVWAPTATSSPPDWWRNGGKINGFLSSERASSVMFGSLMLASLTFPPLWEIESSVRTNWHTWSLSSRYNDRFQSAALLVRYCCCLLKTLLDHWRRLQWSGCVGCVSSKWWLVFKLTQKLLCRWPCECQQSVFRLAPSGIPLHYSILIITMAHCNCEARCPFTAFCETSKHHWAFSLRHIFPR